MIKVLIAINYSAAVPNELFIVQNCLLPFNFKDRHGGGLWV